MNKEQDPFNERYGVLLLLLVVLLLPFIFLAVLVADARDYFKGRTAYNYFNKGES